MPISQQLDHDEAEVVVAASPEAVYALVADVTRTPEYSPEIQRCRWLEPETAGRVGARFEAVNSVGPRKTWVNRPVVTEAEPGRQFAFARTERLIGTIEWRYRFLPEGTGTRVVESYRVTSPVSWLGWLIIGKVYGRPDRRTDLRAGMERSLARIKAILEDAAR